VPCNVLVVLATAAAEEKQDLLSIARTHVASVKHGPLIVKANFNG
jgi:hypothetical protein